MWLESIRFTLGNLAAFKDFARNIPNRSRWKALLDDLFEIEESRLFNCYDAEKMWESGVYKSSPSSNLLKEGEFIAGYFENLKLFYQSIMETDFGVVFLKD